MKAGVGKKVHRVLFVAFKGRESHKLFLSSKNVAAYAT
jgi:hypothetical protein